MSKGTLNAGLVNTGLVNKAALKQQSVVTAAAVFADWLEQLEAAQQILVGFSGGLDSTVLLHLLCELLPPERLTAIHIHHGLSENADEWQRHAKALCHSLGVPLISEAAVVKETGAGLESAARDARYSLFEKYLIEDGVLLLGHHADDQVETVLFRLLRGSGARGLSGIPQTRAVGVGKLIRPLLNRTKSSLQAYAEAKQLSWIEDETNQQGQFDRNYLRNSVIPLLAQRWPDYVQGVVRSAEQSARADQLADSVARADLALLNPRTEQGGWSLDLTQFIQLDPVRQKNLLRYWPEVHGLKALAQTFIDEVMSSLLTAREDSEPKVVRADLQLCRYRQRLYLLKLSGRPKADLDLCLFWSAQEPLILPDGNRLIAEPALGEGLRTDRIERLQVRFRRGGERCQPAGREHSNSLKKLLQEFALEPWWRERVPLFYSDEQLVAVGDLWVCEGWLAGPEIEGLKIFWQTNSL
ncbi:tRNA(Ile)-lysidine synthase [Gammaproteobacteria bacterium MOLA455]|nr:tRNA(Ile)-lysidine synthase [Gammaproteobacteria bacterium MOLA455]